MKDECRTIADIIEGMIDIKVKDHLRDAHGRTYRELKFSRVEDKSSLEQLRANLRDAIERVVTNQ